jgi:hypothetical protein
MTRSSMAVLVLAGLAVGLSAGLSPARADVASPAGPVTGAIIVFLPAPATSPVIEPSPPVLGPKPTLIAPIQPLPSMRTPTPALPVILVLTPTPSTGSLVVPVRVSLGGAGPSLTQLRLVIPGSNPYQNTTVSLEQLLTAVIASLHQSGSLGAPTSGTAGPGPVTTF